jgi:hypothetical protein
MIDRTGGREMILVGAIAATRRATHTLSNTYMYQGTNPFSEALLIERVQIELV